MGLQVWLPLNGNLNNQGLSDVTVTNNGDDATYNNGKIGKGLTCTGSKYLTVNGITLEAEATICYWAKTTVNSKMPWVLKTSEYSDTNLFCYTKYYLDTGDGMNNSFQNDGSDVDVLLDGLWHHFAITFGNNEVILYIDGEYAGTALEFKDPSCTNSIINIGGGFLNGHDYDWDGMLNDFRIYDYCLSPKEVREVSRALIIHYKLNNIVSENSGLLPQGVEIYDYIQSTGTLYINTKIPYNSTNNNYKVEFKFSMYGNRGSYDAIYGAYKGEDYNTLRFVRGNSDTTLFGYYNNIANGGATDIPSVLNNIYEVIQTNSNITVKNISNNTSTTYEYSDNIGTDTSGINFFLFDEAAGGGLSKIKLYYWKIYNGDVLLGNFIPCTYFGIPGMWDIVTNSFFQNSGDGLFTLGSKITLNQYQYLESTGTLYIDTKLYGTSNSKVEIKLSPASDNECGIFGDTDGENNNSFVIARASSDSLIFGLFDNVAPNILTSLPLTIDDVYVLSLDKTGFKNNDTLCRTYNNYTSFTTQDTLKIYKSTGFNKTNFIGKIYYCKIWNNDQLVRDYIPCSYNGTYGLWDKIEWKFYSNSGEDSFTVGESVVVSGLPIYDCSGYNYDGSATGELNYDISSSRYSKCPIVHTLFTVLVDKRPYVVGQTMNEFSTAVWFKTKTSAYQNIISFGNNYFWRIRVYPASKKIGHIIVVGSNTRAFEISISKAISDNKWHHLAVTFKNGIINTYFDGALVNSIDLSNYGTTTKMTQNYPWYVGGIAKNSTFEHIDNGRLSDLRVYASALSAEDINELYKTSAFITDKGVINCYEFEENNVVEIGANGVIKNDTFYEEMKYTPSYVVGGVNNQLYSYKPTANKTNVCLYGPWVVFGNRSKARKYVIELDIDWSGTWASGTSGSLIIKFNGATQKPDSGTWLWSGNVINTALTNKKSLTSLALSAPEGTYHYKTTFIVPADHPYSAMLLALRTDYSDGNGKIGFKNLKIYLYDPTLDSEQVKIGDSYITCNNLIEI